MNKPKRWIPILLIMLAVCVYTFVFHPDEELKALLDTRSAQNLTSEWGDDGKASPIQSPVPTGSESAVWQTSGNTAPTSTSAASSTTASTTTETESPAVADPTDSSTVVTAQTTQPVQIGGEGYPTVYTLNTGYTIGPLLLSKSLEGANQGNFNYNKNKQHVDGQGTLTSAHTYCFFDITIENLENAGREYLLNNISLYATENGARKHLYELRYFDQGADPHKTDFFHVFVAGGEKKTYRVGLILDDARIRQYNWVLAINPEGNMMFNSARELPITML